MSRFLLLIFMMSLMLCCAHQSPQEEDLRTWTELCQQKHPGCELEGLDFSPYGEEICKCKKAGKPLKSPNGDSNDFHP